MKAKCLMGSVLEFTCMEIVYTLMTEDIPDIPYEEDFQKIMEKALTITAGNKDSVCSVVFVNPEQIHEINRNYRKVDRPTDVISFALQDDPSNIFVEEDEQELGDIFINTQAIVDQARDYGHSMRREGAFLFCHGLLHLLGYDHMNPEDEKEMFGLQDEILDQLVSR